MQFSIAMQIGIGYQMKDESKVRKKTSLDDEEEEEEDKEHG